MLLVHLIIILQNSYALSPTILKNKYPCCNEVKAKGNSLYKHKCSTRRSHIVDSSFITSSLSTTTKYKVYHSLCRNLLRLEKRQREKENNMEVHALMKILRVEKKQQKYLLINDKYE